MPSAEAASTTTTSSIAPTSRSATSAATISPTVSAHSRAGRQTDTLCVRSAAIRCAEYGEWWKVRAFAQRSAAVADIASTISSPWPSTAQSSRGARCWTRGARTGGWCAKPTKARVARSSSSCPPELHPDVLAALRAMGIERLYSHQAQALHAATAGPTIVTTGTASGKSLCFNLPTLDILCEQARARALYLYPTKALAQDQARALAAFGLTKRVRPAIYDGDTPREARAQIRSSANVVLTNPDMLHVGILPNHAAWAELFANLAVVVIDEAHVYRGVFGSHVGNVLRRLRRIAAAYGTDPIFLLTSATIANPVELAERLTGLEDVQLIDEDGSPAPRRRIAVWNPPLTDEALGARRSALGEAAELLARLARDGARTICFMKSRKGVEVLSRLVKEDLQDDGPRAGRAGGALPRRLHPPAAARARAAPGARRAARGDHHRRARAGHRHRRARRGGGGHVPRHGRLAAPDVGARRAPRAGPGGVRGGRGRARPVLLPPPRGLPRPARRGGDPRPREPADLPRAPAVRRPRGPAVARRRRVPGPALGGARGGPAERGRAAPSRGGRSRRTRYVPRRPGGYPAAEVSLRSASPESFAIVDVSSGELLGSTEAARAHSTVHEGAIYMHQGRSYEVRELDLERRRALVAPFDGDWYTQPKRETDTEIVRLLDRREALGVTLSFGEVSVTDTVLAYQRRRLADHAQVDIVALELPPTSFPTQALWFELPIGVGAAIGGGRPADGSADVQLADAVPLEILLGSLHATEHAQIAVLPLIAMCDRWDIGGLSTNFHPQTGAPTIFLYDGHPGGIGIARTAFARFEELCEDARRLIAECPCASGCPSCVQSPKCGNLNEPLHKAGALALLERLLAADRERRSDGARRLLRDHARRRSRRHLAHPPCLRGARGGARGSVAAVAGAAAAVGDLRRTGRAHAADAVDAAQGPGQPRPVAGLAARRLRRQHGQRAERGQPDAVHGARGRAQLRRLGRLVSHELPGRAGGHLRAELPVGELPGERVGRRARAGLAQGLLPAVRSARATRGGHAHGGRAHRLGGPRAAVARRLSPHVVQLGRAGRRGGRAPDRRKRALATDASRRRSRPARVDAIRSHARRP